MKNGSWKKKTDDFRNVLSPVEAGGYGDPSMVPCDEAAILVIEIGLLANFPFFNQNPL
jgi:hypothetical protein